MLVFCRSLIAAIFQNVDHAYIETLDRSEAKKWWNYIFIIKRKANFSHFFLFRVQPKMTSSCSRGVAWIIIINAHVLHVFRAHSEGQLHREDKLHKNKKEKFLMGWREWTSAQDRINLRKETRQKAHMYFRRQFTFGRATPQ